MKKLLLILLGIFLLISILGYAYIAMAPDLPSDAEQIIEKATAMELPEYYHGEAKYANNGDIKLWYEVNKAKTAKKGTIILIMGYGSTSMQWPEFFFNPFLDEGYDVIRFDHRDVGKSTWLDNWNESDPYTLSDLAADTKVILDKEEIDKAHIVGMSMGGMVAQTFAIEHPEKTLSLTSMSSSAYFDDEELPGIWPDVMKSIGRYTLKYSFSNSQETSFKYNLVASNLFKGKYELNNINTILKTRYEIEKRNGINPDVGQRHEAAIKSSGSRYDRLKDVDVPTLVVHGKSDPLVNFAHGEKTAELIPHAETFYIDELGHDIPEHLSDQISSRMSVFFNQVTPTAKVNEHNLTETSVSI
jgi:pimeloyl-ACP methyl ester carboxylesterase